MNWTHNKKFLIENSPTIISLLFLMVFGFYLRWHNLYLWSFGYDEIGHLLRANFDFQRMFENVSMPISISRASYWAGRAHVALGNNEEARTWFEKAGEHYTTFYGQLGLAHLKSDKNIKTVASQTSGKPPYQDNQLIKVIDFLNSIGEKDHAEPFFIHLYDMAKNIKEKSAIIKKAQKMRIYYVVVRLARKSINQGMDLAHLAYPAPPLLKLKRANNFYVNDHP